jgi:large subunit ribosomal protein L25
MKSIQINGARRTELSKAAVKKVRTDGKVPCVLYGGKENIHFEVPLLAFQQLVYTPEVHLVNLDVDGATFNAMLKDVQFHPVSDLILHADFQEIFPDKVVEIRIPVKLKGSAEGVKEGGRLVHKMKKVLVSALPDKLPDDLTVDIEALKIGDSVRVSDLGIDGVTFLDAPNNVVVGVRTARVVVEEKPAVEAAEGEAAEGAEGEGQEGAESKEGEAAAEKS